MGQLGIYTSIINITLPSSAKAGDTVHVAVQIQNIWVGQVNVQAIINGNAPINGADGSNTIIIGDQNIDKYYWYTFETDMVMPNQSVTLHIRSRAYSADGYFDDADEYVGISLNNPPLSTGWQKLDTAVATAVRDTSVGGGGWQKLDTAVADVGQGIDWDAFELIQHVDFPETKTYKGAAQEVVSYFTAPSVLSSIKLAKDYLSKIFTDELTKHDEVPLSLDMYKGTGVLLASYIVKITSYHKAPATYSGAAMFDPVTWSVIILAAVIVLGIIAATFFVMKVTDLVWGPPGKESPIATALWPIAIGVVVIGGILLLAGSHKSAVGR